MIFSSKSRASLRTDLYKMEETVPKKVYSPEPDSDLERQSFTEADVALTLESEPTISSIRCISPAESAAPLLAPLHSLISDNSESAEKMEQIFNARSQVFSRRYGAASVCTVLATLNETNFRSLRDRLRAVLPEQVPAAGGRPMIKRKSGSISRLVDDCWALGSSAA